ncbi:MAG: Stp1/IreP family PP2C-type Ser/Thr phosphatase [Anaerolineae bacterium]|jgi:serine/threonine protein phosphatase PrpC|nr:Stp1/IreP family PP2C-type Ser/Thr phosphatase [Anaerolineae bacterium]
MNILRRIFGVEAPPPAEVTAPPAETAETKPLDPLEGPTAPLPHDRVSEESIKTVEVEPVLASTNILDGHTRKLPELDEAVTGRNGRRITYGIKTDVGQVRQNNQDAVLSFLATFDSAERQPEFGLFVVADGMGGHHDGEKASSLAARVVARHTSSEIYLPMLKNEESDADRPTIAEVLRQAIQKANEEVSVTVPEGGTTVTAVAIIGDLAYIAHVGDSRAYIITQDSIEQVTRDHSLVQRLIELDQLTPAEAADHPQRNVLYRAIGQNEHVDVDAITRRLTANSRLLLCSDGLWNLIPEEEIRNTVIGSPSPQQACETLVKLANARGGPDNISVILIKIPE